MHVELTRLPLALSGSVSIILMFFFTFSSLAFTRVHIYCRFSDIWAGTYVSFAKSTSGDIYAWGLNNYYQLGTQDMDNKFVPTLIKSLPAISGWSCLSGGQHHTLALNKDGR